QPFLMAGLVMVTVLHTLAGVSFPAVQYILATLKVVLFGAFTMNTTMSGSRAQLLSAEQLAALRAMPLDLRTVLDHLDLTPDITTYACC
ncbi:hypothetical protein FKP32DRAFT_1536368, partial [Trametes sanguinea]